LKRIAHLTSAHSRHDPRIFLKQCRSLAVAGYDVTLVVADGLGDAKTDGVAFVDAGKATGRLNRFAKTTRRVLEKARDLDADLYHLHDPELLPAAWTLRKMGKHVIFDAHEDLPAQILSKAYLPKSTRRAVSFATAVLERFVASRISFVVAATPAIRNKFSRMGIRALDINNFPLVSEFEANATWDSKAREVCYVGGITAIRGIEQLVGAMASVTSGARLNLVGTFTGAGFENKVKASPGWPNVTYLGQLARSGVREVLTRSLAGIVTFLPEPNHVEAQPNKMFEYMSAGIPLIASDFPLWRDIVEGNNCGICVDPFDSKAIASAIDRLVESPDLARQMGENGRRAVMEQYNWDVEEEKLIDLYAKVLSEAPNA
jgi:glycosyltransferase involved in cell wall biosynthesis